MLQKHRVTLLPRNLPLSSNPTRRWVERRIALGLDRELIAYLDLHRKRLRRMSDSDLVRALLHEHAALTAELQALTAKLRELESRLAARPRRRR